MVEAKQKPTGLGALLGRGLVRALEGFSTLHSAAKIAHAGGVTREAFVSHVAHLAGVAWDTAKPKDAEQTNDFPWRAPGSS